MKNLKSQSVNVINPKNIADLNNYIKSIECGIFCDSGPLHLSKIYSKKGLLISTSVDSKKILSNQDKIVYYNSKYKSTYCMAPCGLTNIINFKNQHGCYDTLKKTKSYIMKNSKTNLLNRGNLESSYTYFTQNMVGCVKFIKFEKIKSLIDEILDSY